MSSLLLSFDVEEYPAQELGIPMTPEGAFSKSADGLEELLLFLKTSRVKATFFVTGEFARAQPKMVKRLVREGHELALHGEAHSHEYHLMGDGKAEGILRQARARMEKEFLTPVVGFRGPRMSRPPYAVLKACGFVYDSSLHPTFIPGRYSHLSEPRQVHLREGLMVVPLSV